MKNVKKNQQSPKKSLVEKLSMKRGRGRPILVEPSAVRSQADNYRVWLARIWNDLGEPLLAARTEQDVIAAVQKALPGVPYSNDLIRFAPVILKVIQGKLPKRQKTKIEFLADSIAGGGRVTPRRSRDICAEERKRDAERHYILQYEYWIKCSCGYEGISNNHRCKECGAVVYVAGSNSEFD